MRGLAIVLGVCLLAPSVARAQGASADELVREARGLAEQQRYAEAIAKLRQADAIQPDPINDCDVARLYRLMGKPADAQLHLDQCESRVGGVLGAGVRENFAIVKEEIDQLLIAGDYGRVEIVSDPPGAIVGVSAFDPEVRFTAGRTIWLPFGSHEVEVTAPGRLPARRTITISDKPPRRELFTLEPEPAPPPPPPPRKRGPLAGVLIGAGVGAIAVGVVFTILALDARDEAQQLGTDGVDRPAYDDAIDRMRLYNVVFDVAYVVGAASVGVGVYLLLRPLPVARERGTGVTIAPTRGGAFVGWRTAW